jgi:hypothetical protein
MMSDARLTGPRRADLPCVVRTGTPYLMRTTNGHGDRRVPAYVDRGKPLQALMLPQRLHTHDQPLFA